MRRFAICEFSTLPASFEEDLAAYAAAGADGISICELKLVEGREAEQLEAFRESGLEASTAVPAVPSILPLPKFPGPERPEVRVEAIVAGMRRLAPFEPSAFVCPSGPAGELDEAEARATVAEGLRVLAERVGPARHPGRARADVELRAGGLDARDHARRRSGARRGGRR